MEQFVLVTLVAVGGDVTLGEFAPVELPADGYLNLADLIEAGHVAVQATISSNSPSDQRRDLIERTLRGLRAF